MRNKTITNAPNIDLLEGDSYQIGGTLGIPVEGVPLAVGADLCFMKDPETEKEYYGFSISEGLGSSEVHAGGSYTKTIKGTKFNIFDAIEKICLRIME